MWFTVNQNSFTLIWRKMNVSSNECGLKRMWSQTNVVSNECGFKWLWSQMTVVSNDCGLIWMWSQMNECGLKWMWSQVNVVSNEKVSCECGLTWLWSQTNVVSNECGLKWMWSQMNVVANEKVSCECGLKYRGLQWSGLLSVYHVGSTKAVAQIIQCLSDELQTLVWSKLQRGCWQTCVDVRKAYSISNIYKRGVLIKQTFSAPCAGNKWSSSPQRFLWECWLLY